MEKIGKTEVKIVTRMDNNPVLMQKYEKMLDFFSVYDILEQTSHCKNIQSIYQNAKTQQKGIVALSLSLHINERTLIRYRKKYLNCLGIFYMAELNGKEIAAADISKILF